MFTRIAHDVSESPWKSLFCALVTVAAAALLAAVYTVCQQQVLRAHQRDAALHAQRVAIANCIQASASATMQSCVQEVAGMPAAGDDGKFIRATLDRSAGMLAGGAANVDGVVPVNFAYR